MALAEANVFDSDLWCEGSEDKLTQVVIKRAGTFAIFATLAPNEEKAIERVVDHLHTPLNCSSNSQTLGELMDLVPNEDAEVITFVESNEAERREILQNQGRLERPEMVSFQQHPSVLFPLTLIV